MSLLQYHSLYIYICFYIVKDDCVFLNDCFTNLPTSQFPMLGCDYMFPVLLVLASLW